jgi:hypothetical protein
MMIWFLLAVIALGTAIPLSLSAMDSLIRREYDLHRSDWEQDGRPIGSFFLPSEARPFRSRFAFHFCTLVWLFSTPQWIRSDATAAAFLRKLRWSTLMGNGAATVLFYLIWRLVVATSLV